MKGETVRPDLLHYSQLWKMIREEQSFGIITSQSFELNASENCKKVLDFINLISNAGYGFISLDCGFEENGNLIEERSMVIPNVTKEEIIDLGIQFNQFSVLYKDYKEFFEIGTNALTGLGDIKSDFNEKGWNKDVKLNSELVREFFITVARGSHRGKKILSELKSPFVQERIALSFNQRAYGGLKNGDEIRIPLL